MNEIHRVPPEGNAAKRPLIGVTGRRNEVIADKAVYEIPDEYFKVVWACGGLPVQLPPFAGEAELAAYMDELDGALFIGGPDIHPSFYGETPVPEVTRILKPEVQESLVCAARLALARPLPVFGVCLGCQLLSAVSGGKLIQDLGPLVPRHRKPGKFIDHTAEILPGTRLAGILGSGPVRINSCHHQAVRPDAPGKNWRVAALDGAVAEAIEQPGEIFRLGVQWHPECSDDHEQQKALFTAFIQAAARRK